MPTSKSLSHQGPLPSAQLGGKTRAGGSVDAETAATGQESSPPVAGSANADPPPTSNSANATGTTPLSSAASDSRKAGGEGATAASVGTTGARLGASSANVSSTATGAPAQRPAAGESAAGASDVPDAAATSAPPRRATASAASSTQTNGAPVDNVADADDLSGAGASPQDAEGSQSDEADGTPRPAHVHHHGPGRRATRGTTAGDPHAPSAAMTPAAFENPLGPLPHGVPVSAPHTPQQPSTAAAAFASSEHLETLEVPSAPVGPGGLPLEAAGGSRELELEHLNATGGSPAQTAAAPVATPILARPAASRASAAGDAAAASSAPTGPRPGGARPAPANLRLPPAVSGRPDIAPAPQAQVSAVFEENANSLIGRMSTAGQAGAVVGGEVERHVGTSGTPGGGSSASTSGGNGGQSGARVVELHENSGQSGGSGGQGEGGLGGSGSGAGRGVQRVDNQSVQQPIQMQAPGRLQALQQTPEQRQLAEKIVMARMENKAPIVLEKAMAQHASSVIEVILKKSYPDEKKREKDASKLVALILRSHGFYTYEHCTRLIDLASDLASMTGKSDPETQRRIADGITYKDLGEVEYLLSKGTPRQRQVITDYLAGQKMAQAGLLHDIGKIKIPKEILYKPGMLTPDEARTMQMHPVYGAQILEAIPPLAHAAPAARHHHERYDGKGYPDRLKGEQIPFEARVIAIVDTFDAMAADRPYRKGLPMDVCRSELIKGKSKQFDPDLVDAFMEVLDNRFVRGGMSMEDYKLGPGA